MDLDFLSNVACLCLQQDANSFLLFNVAKCGLKIMKYFSLVHNWHVPETGENGGALLTNFHVIVYVFWSFFNFHMCWLKVVEFLCFSCLNEDLCPPHLVLNVVAVSPMYVSTWSSCLIVAWYITFFARQSPSTGQLSLFLQLHFLVCSVFAFKIFAL